MKPEQLVLFERYADAVGADRYRVTSIKLDEINGTKKALILDKKDGVSKGFTREEVAQHMSEMISLMRRGENIYYTPLSENKHHILIDDVKDLLGLKLAGFRLAAVIESSPRNFQVIITVSKLCAPEDKEIGNYLSNYFNQKYGDKNFYGCIHPHRAPGFKNFKLKYRDDYGNFPTVRLVEAEGGECDKTLKLSLSIYQQIIDFERRKKEKAEEEKEKEKWFPKYRTAADVAASDDALIMATRAYMAHYYHIIAVLYSQTMPLALDYSRIDSMIALRMRATGHSKQAIAHAIEVMGPSIRIPWKPKPDRNWADYARRTAEYAFSPSGERRLESLQVYLMEWLEAERRHGVDLTGG
jgi:hypothetical protein